MNTSNTNCCSPNLGVVLWPLVAVYSLAYWLVTVALLAAFACLYHLVWMVNGRGEAIALVQALWGRLQMALALSRLKIEGCENIPKTGGCLFAVTHRSYTDIFVFNASVGRPVRWVLKEALLRYPVLGMHLRKAGGAVALDRESPRAAAKVLLEAAKDLEKGDVFVVFPEGTRSAGGMLPFKNGVFALAQRSGVPLVPVAIRGTGRLLPARSLMVHPFKTVTISFLPPLTGAALEGDRDALSVEVRSRLMAQMGESPAEAFPATS